MIVPLVIVMTWSRVDLVLTERISIFHLYQIQTIHLYFIYLF